MKFVSKQVLVDDGGYGDFQEKEVQQQPALVSKVTNQWSGDASLSTSTVVDDDDGAELAPAGEAALLLPRGSCPAGKGATAWTLPGALASGRIGGKVRSIKDEIDNAEKYSTL